MAMEKHKTTTSDLGKVGEKKLQAEKAGVAVTCPQKEENPSAATTAYHCLMNLFPPSSPQHAVIVSTIYEGILKQKDSFGHTPVV